MPTVGEPVLLIPGRALDGSFRAWRYPLFSWLASSRAGPCLPGCGGVLPCPSGDLPSDRLRDEDDGLSAWLYLTEPDSEKPVADRWIYNRISNPESTESYMSREVAPPAPSDFARDGAFVVSPDAPSFRLVWSKDGESVALFDGNILMEFIASGQKRGFSRKMRGSTRPTRGHPLMHPLPLVAECRVRSESIQADLVLLHFARDSKSLKILSILREQLLYANN